MVYGICKRPVTLSYGGHKANWKESNTSMRKITPALLVAVGLVAASIGLAGPASAATSTDGQLTASDARAKHDDCATIHYRFEPAQANSDWQADITITDPHGHESGWDVDHRRDPVP